MTWQGRGPHPGCALPLTHQPWGAGWFLQRQVGLVLHPTPWLVGGRLSPAPSGAKWGERSNARGSSGGAGGQLWSGRKGGSLSLTALAYKLRGLDPGQVHDPAQATMLSAWTGQLGPRPGEHQGGPPHAGVFLGATEAPVPSWKHWVSWRLACHTQWKVPDPLHPEALPQCPWAWGGFPNTLLGGSGDGSRGRQAEGPVCTWGAGFARASCSSTATRQVARKSLGAREKV